jgi:hypothetical protein
MIPARYILWVDSLAGLAVGLGMFALASLLRGIYGMPLGVYYGIAIANVVYGLYSLSLALRRRRSHLSIQVLAVMNATWAGTCVVAIIALFGKVGWLGLGHIGMEGLFVSWLAWMEWKSRYKLAS